MTKALSEWYEYPRGNFWQGQGVHLPSKPHLLQFKTSSNINHILKRTKQVTQDVKSIRGDLENIY